MSMPPIPGIPDPDKGCLGCLYRIQRFFMGCELLVLVVLLGICVAGCAYALVAGVLE